MVVPHRSQARLRRSLPHWAYYALFRPQGARFVRPSRLQPLCGLRLRTALRFVCSPLQPFGPPMFASSLAALPASLGSSYRPALRWPGIPGLRSASRCSSIRNGRPAAPDGLQYSRLSVQHGRSASFASSLAALPASLGSSAAIAATGCAASFALIGLTSACFAHCARPPCAPRPSTPSGLRRLRPVSATGGGLRAPLSRLTPTAPLEPGEPFG